MLLGWCFLRVLHIVFPGSSREFWVIGSVFLECFFGVLGCCEDIYSGLCVFSMVFPGSFKRALGHWQGVSRVFLVCSELLLGCFHCVLDHC